jgi:uncharacterized repeat protein (TIGR01451 family)
MSDQGYRAAKPVYFATRTCALIGAAVIVLGTSQAHAAGTVAGTVINNVATATFDLPGGGESTVTSNTVSLTVDELLDVTVASADPGDVSTAPGATNQVLRFTLTNAGNGNEAFRLTPQGTLGSDDFDPTVTSVVIDANGNNAYDAGVDTVYVSGTDTPALAPDASISIFVLSSIPAGASNGNRGRVDLAAVASTGSGTPGTTIAGQGQGGGNAVVGATGADANDDGFFVISAASVSFVKSATVADQWGGATQVPGSTITYTLTATVSGSGTVNNLRVSDPIPAGTTYKPGSIRLDGGALTDASDADAGNFGSGAINVSLGNVAAGGGAREVKFEVVID